MRSSNLHTCCCAAALLRCCTAVLPYCRTAILPQCRTAALPYCLIAVLPHKSLMTTGATLFAELAVHLQPLYMLLLH
jgi:hypothetical protein